MSYRVKHSKRNSISTRAHVLFSIYQVHQGHRSIFLKSPLLPCKNSLKFETFAIVNGAIFSGTSRVEPPNRMSYVYVFSTAIVCRSRHDFFTYSLLEYVPFFFFIVVKHCVVPICTTNKTGHTMQRFPNEANLKRQWVQFVQVNRTDSSSRSNILLFVAVTFLLFVMRKAIWLKWALKSKIKFFLVLSVPTT